VFVRPKRRVGSTLLLASSGVDQSVGRSPERVPDQATYNLQVVLIKIHLKPVCRRPHEPGTDRNHLGWHCHDYP
jgi:hypothetical protein